MNKSTICIILYNIALVKWSKTTLQKENSDKREKPKFDESCASLLKYTWK